MATMKFRDLVGPVEANRTKLCELALGVQLTGPDFDYLGNLSDEVLLGMAAAETEKSAAIVSGVSDDLRLTLRHRVEAWLRIRKVLAMMFVAGRIPSERLGM
jgi:hypothetical protein